VKKKRKTINISKEVEKSFRELEDTIPDNSAIQEEITLRDEDAITTVEFDPVRDLRDDYDWLSQPVDDWQKKLLLKEEKEGE
tara:strand:+ start:393 stop:638 length:246 start_codon:yes stop_codon:yes gene_type:complete